MMKKCFSTLAWDSATFNDPSMTTMTMTTSVLGWVDTSFVTSYL